MTTDHRQMTTGRMKEIKFHGRGGQGVVMASQMLGLAYFKAGMYPQCYSLFGGERRGAPVVSFLRVDQEKILLKCEIKNPNQLLVFDSSLIDPEEIRKQVVPGTRILVNTSKTAETAERLTGFTLGLVDASSIAERLGLGHVINTTVLGAYCRLFECLPIEKVIEAVTAMVPAKKEENAGAVKEGYNQVTLIEGRK
jgi:2-oxoacid:acceptor oxidoreductase gamma subunit (pyruvate/2-ketoisovalerate family)